MPRAGRYPPIADYAFLSDWRSAALVSRGGSIDWCCMPRIDQGSIFGRLLDRERGGHCAISPEGLTRTGRRYLGDTLVLETMMDGEGGTVRLTDMLVLDPARDDCESHLLRFVEGVHGTVRVRFEVRPRFDYGDVRPWIHRENDGGFGVIGGNDGLIVWSDAPLEMAGDYDLAANADIGAGDRLHLSLRFVQPHRLEAGALGATAAERARRRTLRLWERWATSASGDRRTGPLMRSAVVLKGLTNADTGAIVAAATTSLPETLGGVRNWDYRYSWIRDSTLAARALADFGFDAEADAFRRFVQRSSAGHAEDLRVAYGVNGERRLTEQELPHLQGYARSSPVRVGNGATGQRQLDTLGELMLLAWRWHIRGRSPDEDLWAFLSEIADRAAEIWRLPDSGIWEQRGRRRHFVHSKAMCWAALDRAVMLARDCGLPAARRWTTERAQLRRAIEEHGVDRRRGVFVREFGRRSMDAALLLLPNTGFVEPDSAIMRRTVDAVWEELEDGGLLRRYTVDDNLPGEEGVFLPATFWLAECLAAQGRTDEAVAVFDRAAETANDLGLFAEEYCPDRRLMLGNFPQALTHLAHLAAGTALARATGAGVF